MLLVRNLTLDPDEGSDVLAHKLRRRLGLRGDTPLRYTIYRRSLDARHRRKPRFVYQLLVEIPEAEVARSLKDAGRRGQIALYTPPPSVWPTPSASSTGHDAWDQTVGREARGAEDMADTHADAPHLPRQSASPLVIGAGPAGLFAALYLARAGLAPIIVEQGRPIPERVRAVERFWSDGVLDPHCNVPFGEGGAGTFSDGKLTARSKDPRVSAVLETFVEAGADTDILYEALPHIGSDRLRAVTIRLRRMIEAAGGRFFFGHRVDGLDAKARDETSDTSSDAPGSGNPVTVSLTRLGDAHDHGGGEVADGKGSADESLRCTVPAVLIACGHSARPLFRHLAASGVAMEAKAFAVGARLEHAQCFLDASQYGRWVDHPALPTASYRMTASAGDRRAYSFCMCPGGEVVAAASEPSQLVVNGMSYHARDLPNGNAAILIPVGPEDYGNDILAGIRFQERLERRAFEAGGGRFRAPVMDAAHFCGLASETSEAVTPSYRLGTTDTDLGEVLPDPVAAMLRDGLLHMEAQWPGFVSGRAGDGQIYPRPCLTAVESRTSSPLRILRDPRRLESLNRRGLYPTGEGAGYAGGIVSSAVDGLRVAEAVTRALTPPVHHSDTVSP